MKRIAATLLTALMSLAIIPVTPAAATPAELTIATFNASLNRSEAGQLIVDLSTPENDQARNVAETIQRADADVLLINEFDHDDAGKAVDLFRTNYLEVSQNGAPISQYPYSWSGPVNTGVPSGFDLNRDGSVGGPDDALGFGFFPGQYGMVIYSKYPILDDQVRTFQNFLWADMPGALLPSVPGTNDGWYSDESLEVLPLSSKTHADVAIDVDGTTVHVLAAHPTPPSFDGEEQRNMRRNHDEIRLWADYIEGTADYLYDDEGIYGSLPSGAAFVIMGDYNADAEDGNSWPGAIDQLLSSSRVLDPLPASDGAVEAAELQGGDNDTHVSDPRYDTADFGEPTPGNLRVDYVLPSVAALTVRDAGVFWPTTEDSLYRLTGEFP
ncbi:MAG: endonuclease/exonuclease/phosphatase family protein, partial [Arachnia sp.]